ncbi:LysR family transcriptional regulator protein (plasmid) [Rhizobium sp. CIAT894]|uniref:LysR family transcriptional regulator n=1 Tax=Rhizobium sp. CIAT894 TaxID=2020312 RepID=UPI000A1F873F|nr:LysR family transcriptional regulator [Rhizobium sp. CIAT894]ARM91942.1 LysR family transcriptional regulator protein [Rhizobium sp. CIAT894]
MAEQIGIDRLTGIIAFARAASLGSYTAAARSLSISPSAISKSVQRLEERLGVRLFSRTTRSLTLTSEGLALHERALRLLQQAEEIEQAAAATRAEPAGLMKITAPLPVGVHLISPHLPAFRERYPKVSIDLRLGDTFTDLVEEGIDVAIRVGQPVDSRLIARTLAPNRVCAFASPAYLERRGIPTRPEDLDGHDCVNFRYQSSGQSMRWPFRTGERIQEVLPNANIVVDNSDAVVAILVNDGGIGISATYIAGPYVARGELVPVLKTYWMDRHHITALWPESRRGNPNVRAFVAFLVELFPDPTPWDTAFALA